MDDDLWGDAPPPRQPSAAQDPGPEQHIRTMRPAFRSLAPLMALFVAILVLATIFRYTITEQIYYLTEAQFPWTEETFILVTFLPYAIPGIIGFWIALRALVLYMTSYDLSDRRLRLHHGVIYRRHDEIALHRIRDYAVSRSLMSLILGIGTIKLVTRDPTLGTVHMFDIRDAVACSENIRKSAYAWKRKIGYREFDTGDLG